MWHRWCCVVVCVTKLCDCRWFCDCQCCERVNNCPQGTLLIRMQLYSAQELYASLENSCALSRNICGVFLIKTSTSYMCVSCSLRNSHFPSSCCWRLPWHVPRLEKLQLARQCSPFNNVKKEKGTPKKQGHKQLHPLHPASMKKKKQPLPKTKRPHLLSHRPPEM